MRGIYQTTTMENLLNENVEILFSELSWTPLPERSINSYRK